MSGFPRRRRPDLDGPGDCGPAEDGRTGRGLWLRAPETVMRLARLGAFHQTRLSFLRATLRQVAADGYRFGYERWEIGDDGTGTAVYAARGPERGLFAGLFRARPRPGDAHRPGDRRSLGRHIRAV